MTNTYIVGCQQMEGAKQLVVLEVEGAGGLELAAEVELHGRLESGLLLELQGSQLLLVVVVLAAGGPGRPPRAALVVLVGVHVGVLRVVLCTVVEVRHDCERWCRSEWEVALLILSMLTVLGGRLPVALVECSAINSR
jgi:hypothetical protein